MRYLLAFLAVTASTATPAAADCGCGVTLLTERVVEGRPSIVVAMACPRSPQPGPTLVDARGEHVPTAIAATHAGYNGSQQLVVTPDRPLAPGAYQLVYAERDRTRTSLALTVVASDPRAAAPRWAGAPRVLEQREVAYGCGPSQTVRVAAGEGATLAFVELAGMAGYLPVRDGAISIGHGMCGGAFELTKGRRYTAQLTLLAPERGTQAASTPVTFTYAP